MKDGVQVAQQMYWIQGTLSQSGTRWEQNVLDPRLRTSWNQKVSGDV